MSKQYPGGLITKSPVTPSGPYSNDTASGIWTLDQQAYWQKLGQWPTAGNNPVDPQFNYVTMLLHGDGTNGAQNNTFLDSSTNNFTITRNGNTTQGSFSPYGSNWGNYFLNTSNGNRIDWDFSGSPAENAVAGTNYTIEFWVFRLPKSGTYQTIFSTENDSNNFVVSGSNFQVTSNGGTQMFLINADTYVPLNTWTHVALTCSSTTWTLYFNGTSYGTYSGASKTSAGYGTAQLGGRGDMNGCGYLSNFRISTTSRYSGNFTPSTTPFVADGSTAMLTCQSNRFIDTSSNAQALRVNGTMSVQRFNPFGASTAYSTSVIGGSGYFDGTGDYLQVANNSAFDFGSGDWTIEFWMYGVTQAGGSLQPIINKGTDFGAIYAPYDVVQSGLDIQLYLNGTSSGWNIASGVTIGTIALNEWTHFAITRSGTTFKAFKNGVQTWTTTNSQAMWVNTYPFRLAATSDAGSFWSGYLSDVRIVKGTAVYTSAFTPPTAPLTAITNTSLLTNMTNGAIYDNAMMNDLETVGNAQISTSVKKYGTGSLAFDGTGDGLYRPSSDLFNFGSGSFTIEFWMYFSSKTGYQTLASYGYSPLTATGWLAQTGNGDGKIIFYKTNSGSTTVIATDAGSTVNTGQWYHIAIVKNGTTTTIYRDGTSVGSGSDTNTYSATANFYVGGGSGTGFNNYYFNGYIDDLRITKGYARYTANFTPPTAAFFNYGPN